MCDPSDCTQVGGGSLVALIKAAVVRVRGRCCRCPGAPPISYPPVKRTCQYEADRNRRDEGYKVRGCFGAACINRFCMNFSLSLQLFFHHNLTMIMSVHIEAVCLLLSASSLFQCSHCPGSIPA